ncbi:MAG: hypothetical protein K8U03_02145 [Planctomycetia bacterium]|nr:hypothetical protein [Planctomycetia bacterium]
MKRIGFRMLGLRMFRGAPVALALGLTQAPTLYAVEEYENFLQGLRQKGYYDVAIDYLDAMVKSPLLTETQRQMIPFEAARTNLEASRSERDNVVREKLLDGAKAKFQEFVAANPSHPQAPGAETQMGAVLVERGRAKVEQAVRPEFEKQKPALMEEARKFFDESEKVFLQAEEKFAKLLQTFPKFMTPDDPRVALRERAKGDLIQAHMFHAKGLYEKSRTFVDQSPEWKKALLTAAEKYGSIYKDYRTLIAGLAARLQEGQCYQELKDTKRALGLYNDLLGQPDDLKSLRPYKASALYLSLQCWTAETEKLYELAAIQAEEFIRGSSNEELSRPEWLAVRYYGAVANKLWSGTFPAGAKGEEATKKQRALDHAADYAEVVASATGEYQDLARALLKEIGSNVDPNREPRTFLEAQNRGTEEMTKFSAAVAEAQKATDPAIQAAKQKEANTARDGALTMFAKAVTLADENTSFDDRNIVRYYICYLMYTQGKTYEPAVMGEFLLKFYPNSGGARSAAQIALAGYVNEYQNNQQLLLENKKPFDAAFDRKKMYSIASEITKRWKGEKEADDAWNILLAIAINEKNLPDILLALGSIQETAAIRSDAEMRAAGTLWGLYSEQLGIDDGAPTKMPAADMQNLAVQTNAILEKAIERERPKLDAVEKLTVQHADALRFLCETRIALGQNAKALEILEDPKLGLLTLVRNAAKNPAATVAPIPIEAYKLALQAYILNDKVDEAQKLTPELDALMAKAGAGGDTKEQLAGTYLNLALRLEKQIEQNRSTKNIEGIKKSSKGFAFFLGEVKKAYLPAVEQYNQLPTDKKTMYFQNANWASENLYKLGSDLLDQKEVSAEDRTTAVDLLKRSSEIDDQLAPLTEANSDAQLIVKLRKARAMRRASNYVESVNALADVLLGRRNLMEAQVEAAETLVARAVNNKEPLMFARAIEGSRPDPKTKENIIWGWKRIADTMRRIPQFQPPVAPKAPADAAAADVKAKYQKDLAAFEEAKQQHTAYRRLFHVGRYNMALCYYQNALVAATPAERSKLLNSVTYSIENTKDYDPDMGGVEWKPKYKDLNDKATKALTQ